MRALSRASLTGAGAALLGIVVMLSPFGLPLEERFGLSWLFWTRGPVAAPADVAVVSLDRRSSEELGLPAQTRDWPRRIYARLIERLVEFDASVVVFDLILDRPRTAADDAALAAAIGAANRVILFDYLDRTVRPLGDGSGAVAGLASSEQLRPPLPAFVDVAAGSGPFPLPKVPTQVSQFWAFGANLEDFPSLPVVALQRRALDVYPHWRALLRQAGMRGAETLPADRRALERAAALKQVIGEVRAAFLADPGLAARASARLETASLSVADRRTLRALITLYGGPDKHYLNFYGPAGTVLTTPLYRLLGDNAETRAAELAGRVVFVGLSDLNNPHDDNFPTVFSRSNGVELGGVEIAATALANLLEDRLLQRVGAWTALAWLGLFGFAIGLVARRLPAVTAIPAALLLAALLYAGAELAFAREQLWLPVAIPLLIQLPLGLFAGLVLQYREAQRARANLSRGMAYYLPPKVALGFAEAALDPAGLKERVFAACMVTDASRFTTLAEGMAPEELSEFLDQYFAILFGVVERHGGLVTDVVGDGTTSVWTAAKPERECRLRACLAALEIDRAIRAFNGEHHPRCLPTRIGLNVGDVVLGNVGGSGRFAYSVIGDCANTAARLESLNKQLGTRIIAARAVVEGLDEIVSRPLGRFQLVGKGGALPVVEVVGRAADTRPTELAPGFAAALEEFEQGRWANAARRFDTILAARPSDGPASFYRKHCVQYLNGTCVPTAHGAVRLDRK
ncbi:MAG: CHASE2 domain-containing protein [Geminicoccaceae bacterium]